MPMTQISPFCRVAPFSVVLRVLLFLVLSLLAAPVPSYSSGDDSAVDKFPRKDNISIYVKLVEYLKHDYDPLAFPLCSQPPSGQKNQTSPFKVMVDLYLFRLFSLDSPTQQLTMDTWIEMNWNDCGLKWDPADFFGLEEITLPADNVWFPEIVSYQSLHGNYEEGLFVFGSSRARIRYDGSVMLGGQFLFRTFCRLNIRNYPYDTQLCNITFASWTQDAKDLQLVRKSDSVHDMEGHSLKDASNGEWDVLGFQSSNQISYYHDELFSNTSSRQRSCAEVIFTLKLKRKATFVETYLLLPCVILFWLAWVTFLLPLECGEKIGLCMTVLLSQIVLLLVLAESIPRTATDLPALGDFYLLSILLVLLCVLLSAFVENVGRKQDDIVMPQWLACIVDSPVVMRHCVRLASQRSDDELTKWSLLALLMDRVFLVVYLVLSIALTVFIYTY